MLVLIGLVVVLALGEVDLFQFRITTAATITLGQNEGVSMIDNPIQVSLPAKDPASAISFGSLPRKTMKGHSPVVLMVMVMVMVVVVVVVMVTVVVAVVVVFPGSPHLHDLSSTTPQREATLIK